MFLKKEEKSAEDFWRDYEEKTGEQVLSRTMGKYVSGWDEFDEKNWGGIWGLIITTSGGFRFHHFPQNSWIDSMTRFAEKEPPKDKTIFIPNEKIISIELAKEKKRWLFFNPVEKHLVIRYTQETGTEKSLLFTDIAPGFSVSQ